MKYQSPADSYVWSSSLVWPELPRGICFADDPAETVEDPVPEPVKPEPEPAADLVPDPVTTDPASDPAVVSDPADPDPKPKLTGEQRRIARQADKIKKLEEELNRVRAAAKPDAPVDSAAPPDFDTKVNERAAELLAAREFDQACEAAASLGKKTFADFDEKISEIVSLVDRNDPASVVAYNSMVAAALETGKAHEVLHALGSDPDEAERILALPPVRMAVAIANLAGPSPAPARVSAAPRPITPVGSRGAQHTTISPADPSKADTLSTAEWMKRREAQVAQRNGAAR